MEEADVLVVGGGIAGASFASLAARAGRRVLVLEAGSAPGGALATAAHPSGFWLELGAHTLYRSYTAAIEALEAAGLSGAVVERGKPVLRLLEGERILPGKNLGALLRRCDKLELLRAVPRWLRASREGRTVREHYGSLVGQRNYDRVLGRVLSAVPSQPADDIPAELLFKRRDARRLDLPRSFTLEGGLRRLVLGLLAHPSIEVRTEAGVERVRGGGGGSSAVRLGSGEELAAGVVALAVPPRSAAACLGEARPALARHVARIDEARVQSLGVVLPARRVPFGYATFLVPVAGELLSVVTRDVVPDPDWRGFTFHFRPGQGHEARLARAAAVLGVRASDLEAPSERESVLPAPRAGHADLVAAIDAELAGGRLALTGNWFTGFSIEDCVRRSASEWSRLAAS